MSRTDALLIEVSDVRGAGSKRRCSWRGIFNSRVDDGALIHSLPICRQKIRNSRTLPVTSSF